MFDFLPENLRKKAFIAGGWAACPALATDRDVWVTIDRDTDLTALRQHLEGRALFYEVDFQTKTADYPEGTSKFCDLIYPWEKVQLLITHWGPEDVLDSFDISTHQIAITADGRVIKGKKWTSPIEPVTIIKRNGPTTDERMKKISKRFGQMLDDTPLTERVLNRLKGWTFNGK